MQWIIKKNNWKINTINYMQWIIKKNNWKINTINYMQWIIKKNKSNYQINIIKFSFLYVMNN